jgi:CDP-diacylglycerol---glycerol-3-phosphate 3-phosphatidyltransferase
MISTYNIKPKFQQLLFPVLTQLHHWKVTANQLTLTAVAWSALLGILLFYAPTHPLFLIVVVVGLLVRMALNALDGMMAKTFNQQTKLGEILNELGDVVSDTFIFLGLLGFSFVNQHLIYLFIISALINEFAGILAKVISGTRGYYGPMGKSDRALFLGLWCLVFYIHSAIIPIFNASLISASILMAISTYKRLSTSLK